MSLPSGNPFTGTQTKATVACTYEIAAGTPVNALLPTPPKLKAITGPMLSDDLELVPEAAFAAPLPQNTSLESERKETFKQIAKIAYLNRQRTDGFIKALSARRADLSGLPLVTDDACRIDEERSKQFQAALDFIAAAKVGDANAESDSLKTFWHNFQQGCAAADKETDKTVCEQIALARIAALMQVLAPEPAAMRQGLVSYLAGVMHPEATRALAKLAIFSQEEAIRQTAIDALKLRRERDYTAVLLQGLRYPWPAVAKRAAEAVVKLEREDMIGQLVALLESPDPRVPVLREVKGKKTLVVRELIKIHHVRNCLLCHPPGNPPHAETGEFRPELDPSATYPTASLPVMQGGNLAGFGYGGGGRQLQDLIVRIDVTYLRQDFSAMLPVGDRDSNRDMQRFDFLVRTRVLSEKEAAMYNAKLAKREPGAVTPYERAILAALRELTGRDAAPTAAAWRELLGLAAAKQ